MAAIRPQYAAHPLEPGTKSIRLAFLDGMSVSDSNHVTIYVGLKVADITNPEDRPTWSALSYCWNPLYHEFSDLRVSLQDSIPRMEMRSLHIDDQGQLEDITICLDESPIEAHRNLKAALYRLSLGSTFRNKELVHLGSASVLRPVIAQGSYFGVDALCIDQESTVERNHQVALMSTIYSCAKRVIVWLGALQTEDDTYIQEYTISNPYWKRMWIVQEIVLARKLEFLFGHHRFAEHFFRRWYTEHIAELKTPRFARILRQREWRAYALAKDEHQTGLFLHPNPVWSDDTELMLGRPSLPDLLDQHAASECSDPRDKIYALLGLLPGEYPIKADYSRSLEDVFMDVIHVEYGTSVHDAVRWWQILSSTSEIGQDHRGRPCFADRKLQLYVSYYAEERDAEACQSMRRQKSPEDFVAWLEDEV